MKPLPEFEETNLVISCNYKKQSEKIKKLLEHYFPDYEYELKSNGGNYWEVRVGGGLSEFALNEIQSFSSGVFVILNEYVGDY